MDATACDAGEKEGFAVLFVLTGEVQTGKTHWLEQLVDVLAQKGVSCAGVIAPGVWRRRDSGEAPSAFEQSLGASENDAFEKLGIDNVLLPGGRRVPFARRRDLAEGASDWGDHRQSAKANLGWAISDDALMQVNEHFAALVQQDSAGQAGELLVVDELGRLELMFGGGLVAAMSLLDQGPTARFPHALVVVRAPLLSYAHKRFECTWGSLVAIGPGEVGAAAVLRAFGIR